MFILDTNVVSELMKHKPDPLVVDWIDTHSEDDVYLTTVTTAEIGYGIERLAEGKKRTGLEDAFKAITRVLFKERVLSFDHDASLLYGPIVQSRIKQGFQIATMDAIIACICQSRDAILVTRNTRDFEGLGLSIINPWEAVDRGD
jgi:predicted nucleic acid-binding protein